MTCQWCNVADAVTEVVLEPAKYGKDKRTGVKVQKKPAKKLRVCRDCKRSLERQMNDEARRKAQP